MNDMLAFAILSWAWRRLSFFFVYFQPLCICWRTIIYISPSPVPAPSVCPFSQHAQSPKPSRWSCPAWPASRTRDTSIPLSTAWTGSRCLPGSFSPSPLRYRPETSTRCCANYGRTCNVAVLKGALMSLLWVDMTCRARLCSQQMFPAFYVHSQPTPGEKIALETTKPLRCFLVSWFIGVAARRRQSSGTVFFKHCCPCLLFLSPFGLWSRFFMRSSCTPTSSTRFARAMP